MTAILHVHAQLVPHDEAFIVGNREGLLALRKAIDAALEGGRGEAEAFVSDGEGFSAYVILQEGDLWSSEWIKAVVPYVKDWAAEDRKNVVWPWSRIKNE
ncbi:MAG: hypothetical protein C4570_07170 [Ammonifex sp.]|jgi:hypothetical protein|nr:MAG: hypothetical protein C4570_07170 [Ammonifex sp.]